MGEARNDSDQICITCGKHGGTCRLADDPTTCMRQQIDNLKAAFRVNALRWNPSLSHEQITDEIERIVGEVAP